MATSSSEMFDRVLAYCGFSSVLGPGILARALDDEGVAKAAATVADYKRALPRIEARMAVYVPAEEVAHRSRRIVGYLAFADGDLDFDDEQEFSRIGHSYAELKARAAAEEAARAQDAGRTSEPSPRAVSGVMERADVSESARVRARDAREQK